MTGDGVLYLSAEVTATHHKLEGDSDERIDAKLSALAALATLVSVAALNTQASATISNPAADQRMLVGTDIVTPMIARVEPISEPKVPLIRVAPRCGSCGMDEIFDDG